MGLSRRYARTFAGKTVLITGAGSGMGRAMALLLAEAGSTCILLDIDAESATETLSLVEARGGRGEAHGQDVADYETYETLAADIQSRHGALDILINNAGIGIAGESLATSPQQWRRIVDVNLLGVVHGCLLFVPAMIDAGRGHVVNMASLASYVAPKEMGAYAATKFAVRGYSEALADELRPHRIPVTIVCPGIIATNITAAMETVGAMSTPGRQDKVVEFYKKRNYTAEKAARKILEGVARKKKLLPVSPEAWFAWYAKRFAPGLLDMLDMDRVIGR